jgi:hypothetical protein
MCASNTDNGCGGTASKRPVDAAGTAAAMDGPSKSLAGVAAHTRLGAHGGAHSPLENRHTDAGFPQRQQAILLESGTATDNGNGPLASRRQPR